MHGECTTCTAMPLNGRSPDMRHEHLIQSGTQLAPSPPMSTHRQAVLRLQPETKIFGALGHEIADSISGSIVEIKDGTIYKSVITSIDKGQRGIAGAKNAKFYSNDKYGDINKNSKVGIYGLYNKDISGYKTLRVGDLDSIKLGKAYIYTVLDGENIEKYEIIIDNVNYGLTKNIHFEIISDELINKTGGIIQGMSGSPIVQNDLIIGAVTHVIVDNPTTGYGVSIINMLKEGER